MANRFSRGIKDARLSPKRARKVSKARRKAPDKDTLRELYITKFYCPEAKPVGRYVSFRFCIGCPDTFLPQEQAGLYLRWLRAANFGTHWEACWPLDENTTAQPSTIEGSGDDRHQKPR
jgi:hypothetical protein